MRVGNVPMSVKKLKQNFFFQADEPCDCSNLVSFLKA
jgi:hypothetical protein